MAQRWAVVRLLDAGLHYAEISRNDRRQHRDHHPDRLVAQPRRGRLPRGDARQAREGTTPTRSRRAMTVASAWRSRTRAGWSNRRCGCSTTPASSSTSTTGASSRASRTTTSTSCSSGRTTSSSSSATASPTSGSPVSTCSARPAPSCHGSATLGYGRCRLAAAVPNDSPFQTVEDLAGLRVATAHPNTSRRFFEEHGHRGRDHPDLRRR